MRHEEITRLVTSATDELEGKIKEIDKETGWAYHEVLYRALDALERVSEHLTEENRR